MKIAIHLLLGVTLLLSSSCTSSQKSTLANTQQPASKSSLEYLREGSAYFQKGKYQQAIDPYQKALDLEKEQPALDKTMWRVLVDNLAMSYGITNNLPKAKELLEYGIAKDKDYPMFYYLMANTYAEMNDEEKTIAYLTEAFARKANMNVGEQMPDPATDDSFQRFMKSSKFLKAIKGMKQTG
jgi:predicted Zn-dependent protease